MSVQDKVLMRKIKKRETQKLRLLQQRESEKLKKASKASESEESVEGVGKGVKRQVDTTTNNGPENGPSKTKRKKTKKKKDVDSEDNNTVEDPGTVDPTADDSNNENRLALKKEPIYVGVDDSKQEATVSGLEQGYIACPSDKRLLVLFTFLKKNRKKKVMVFFSSCMSVKFHHELFNYIDLPVMCIHGKQKQNKRTTTFFQFCNAETGILLCTDVAARGLDIPAVDWIVQYDPPDDPKEYIHRVGRTARGEGGSGHALLMLRPKELGFLRYLKQAKVPLNEFEFSWSKIADIQAQLENLIGRNYFLNTSAKEAFKAYVRAYDSHHLKTIFDISTLDLAEVALSFGFKVPPAVDLNVAAKKGKRPEKSRKGGGGFGVIKTVSKYMPSYNKQGSHF
ncbi:hypothetical protein NQ315_012591 [Exocentrus adspersus]|uniref:ATP-dependent RNA helicase n=1 Tax=Exocentrus adspersus TaxID=1586481 RepID=A0AAV8VRV3_9CUCU|nr:hypothetical protein NQ315_012591 [Exocentrus adspersus]